MIHNKVLEFRLDMNGRARDIGAWYHLALIFLNSDIGALQVGNLID